MVHHPVILWNKPVEIDAGQSAQDEDRSVKGNDTLFRRRAVYEVEMAGKAVPGEQAAFILAGPAMPNLVL